MIVCGSNPQIILRIVQWVNRLTHHCSSFPLCAREMPTLGMFRGDGAAGRHNLGGAGLHQFPSRRFVDRDRQRDVGQDVELQRRVGGAPDARVGGNRGNFSAGRLHEIIDNQESRNT